MSDLYPLKTQWTVNSINYKVLRKNRVLLLILSWSTNGLLRERSPYLLNAGSLMPVSYTASISLKTIDTWTQISSVIYATIYFVTQHSRVSTVVTYCASASVLARSLHSWLIDALEFSDKSIGFSNRWSQLRLFTARCSSSRRQFYNEWYSSLILILYRAISRIHGNICKLHHQ